MVSALVSRSSGTGPLHCGQDTTLRVPLSTPMHKLNSAGRWGGRGRSPALDGHPI